MSYPMAGSVAVGALSPDREWFWDGVRWIPSLSIDGLWRWDGKGWMPAADTRPKWAKPYESPGARAIFVMASFTVVIAAYAIWTIADLAAIAIYASSGGQPSSGQQDAIVLVGGLPGLLAFPALIVSAVARSVWMHRVYRNLPALGARRLRYSPKWAAGGWYVPILSLFRPLQIVREIWTSTTPGIAWKLLDVWWAIYLASNIFALFARRGNFGGGLDEGLDAMVNILVIVSAILTIVIVRRITNRQEELFRANQPGVN
jgi:hypothetical protein